MVLTPLPCFLMSLRSFIILSNSDCSSSAFCVCSAIFSLNLRGFEDIADAPDEAAAAVAPIVAMAPTVAEMLDVGVGEVMAYASCTTRNSLSELDKITALPILVRIS